MPKMTIGITGLRGNLERDDGIEVPYWGPSIASKVTLSEQSRQADLMKSVN